jgi:hypothetical protein
MYKSADFYPLGSNELKNINPKIAAGLPGV